MNKQEVREVPLPELLKHVQRDFVDLVDAEKALAKKELSQKLSELKRDGVEALTAGGLLAIGALCLVAALILALATAMAAWLSALLVGVFLATVGAVLFARFRSNMKRFDPALENTQRNISEDTRTLKEAVR